MRLFVALELPEPTRRRLAERVAGARRDAPAARWVRRDAMHLTLAFLGEVSGDLLPALDAALAPAFARHPGFDAGVGGSLGAFPPRGKARVLWAAVRVDENPSDHAPTDRRPEPLHALRRDVEQALASIATGDGPGDGALDTPETRSYHPHVTLARCRTPWPRAAVERFAAAAGGPALPLPVRRGVLMQSHLEPRGARYEIVSTYPTAPPHAGDGADRQPGGGDR